MHKNLVLLLVATVLSAGSASSQDNIRLNQIGYYPDGPKTAIVVGATSDAFTVVSESDGQTVHQGTLGEETLWDLSGERVRRADFSAVTRPGRYRLQVAGAGDSYIFEVAPDVHRRIAAAAIKGFYYQRASTELLPEHAGKWSRPAGHPDDQVQVHPSAASDSRPAGTIISAPRGWYDAGDYNKYIVNSGITTGTLLSLYEDYPAFAESLELNIPESENGVPDLLDEVRWNLEWMLAMQDPVDGGVYAKLTTARFEGMVTPDAATSQRYVVQKSAPAALDFAAVAAQAARVFRAYDDAYPGLAQRSLDAAIAAWQWARSNPDVMYNQGAMNEQFDPDVSTGGYGDRNVSDEFAWAAAELFVTTGADSFLAAVEIIPDEELRLPSWGQVRALAYYTLARHGQHLSGAARPLIDRAERAIVALADQFAAAVEASPYGTSLASRRDFPWGSNAVAANQGIALVNAYRLRGDEKYLYAALANLDYLLGKNATGYSFLTGYGSKTPTHPHHRPSESDDVAEPVPGLLAGGPNPSQQDRCTYPASEPARSYVDDVCSYASNEIAINWNAPFAYLAGAVEAEMQKH